MAKEKRKAIKTMAEFEQEFGHFRVNVKELTKESGYYPTGSLRLDKKLGGGVPMGRMVEFYGPPGGSKTTLALSTASGVLAAGGVVCYYDLERGLDLQSEGVIDEEGFIDANALRSVDMEQHVRSRESWLRKNGIDPEHENFHIYDPPSGEDLFLMMAAQVQAQLFDLIIVDSVPAIVPRSVLEGLPGEATYGARAKLLSEELPRLSRLYSGNTKTTIIFINQVRENIGAQVKSQKSTGGFALDHFVRTKIKLTRIGRNTKGNDIISESICKLEKNMTGAYAQESIFISAERGVDILSELVKFGIDFGYIRNNKNWYYLFENPVDTEAAKKVKSMSDIPGFVASFNGEGALLDYMAKNGWKEKLLPLARKALGLAHS